jgi:hypothetical protein
LPGRHGSPVPSADRPNWPATYAPRVPIAQVCANRSTGPYDGSFICRPPKSGVAADAVVVSAVSNAAAQISEASDFKCSPIGREYASSNATGTQKLRTVVEQ